ncbi:MAG: hypothetical protein WEB53_05195 [Akkermansiaceae bacterium]
MHSSQDSPSPLAAKIEEAEAKLEQLELEIEEIGMPAATELRRRLEALKIEERALKRNFEESIQRGEPDSVRMAKIETLLRHIENEEYSVGHDADFLHQAAPSSMAVVAETGAHVVDLLARGVKHVVGGHHPLGSSVFVNHSHDELVDFHGLVSEPDAKLTDKEGGEC